MIISTNLTISGIDETSFATDKSILENIIADITNSSASSVEATFIEMLESITNRNALSYHDWSNVRPGRSNENRALINVAVKPRDTPHETYTILKMNTSISFREEINLGLQNQSIESSVISVSQITRIPGELIGITLLYSLYGFGCMKIFTDIYVCI